jgi:hypothetical protein
MLLLDQDEQHVELAHGSETSRDFAQPPDELSRDDVVELKHRHELAKAARRHARAMERRDVALFESGQRARQTIEPASEQ